MPMTVGTLEAVSQALVHKGACKKQQQQQQQQQQQPQQYITYRHFGTSMAEPTFADSQTPEPTFADSQTPPMHLVWVMCKIRNGRPFPLLMMFPVFMHYEELANRLQASF